MRFHQGWGAAALLSLATAYAGVSMVAGRSARAERPPELRADDAALDVWRAAALVVRDNAVIVDVRSKEHFDLYHLPSSISAPGAGAKAAVAAAEGKGVLLLVAETDKDGARLVAEGGPAKVHYVKDGVRAWYLAFEVPIPLFTDKPSPYGYDEALGTLRGWFRGDRSDRSKALEAVGILSKSGYEPTLLQGRKPASTTSAKKKIAGGCGG